MSLRTKVITTFCFLGAFGFVITNAFLNQWLLSLLTIATVASAEQFAGAIYYKLFTTGVIVGSITFNLLVGWILFLIRVKTDSVVSSLVCGIVAVIFGASASYCARKLAVLCDCTSGFIVENYSQTDRSYRGFLILSMFCGTGFIYSYVLLGISGDKSFVNFLWCSPIITIFVWLNIICFTYNFYYALLMAILTLSLVIGFILLIAINWGSLCSIQIGLLMAALIFEILTVVFIAIANSSAEHLDKETTEE